MLKLIVCFLILCFAWNIFYLSTVTHCVGEETVIKVDRIFGTRYTGIKLGKRMGFPTVNIMLDRPIECGIYDGKSHHGPATIIVGKRDDTKAFVNFMTFTDKMDKVKRFEFWDLTRIVNKDSEFVSTYNKGCC